MCGNAFLVKGKVWGPEAWGPSTCAFEEEQADGRLDRAATTFLDHACYLARPSGIGYDSASTPMFPPAEFEQAYYDRQAAPAEVAALT